MPSLKLFCTPTCIYLSNYCLAAMAPNCSSRGKYNYSSKTLTSDSQCLHCGKMYKSQGIKRHQSTCKMRDAEGQEAFALEFERDQWSVLGESLCLNPSIVAQYSCYLFLLDFKSTPQETSMNSNLRSSGWSFTHRRGWPISCKPRIASWHGARYGILLNFDGRMFTLTFPTLTAGLDNHMEFDAGNEGVQSPGMCFFIHFLDATNWQLSMQR